MTRTRRLCLLAAAVTAAACGGEENVEVAGPELLQLGAEQVMVGVEHYMTREGLRRAHLEADTLYFLEEGSRVHLRHYTVDFFDEQGGSRSVLSARDGLYDLQTGDMEATDSVIVVDADESQRLSTEHLTYDAATDRLRSEVPFVLVQGRDTTRGEGFVTDPGLDSLEVTGPSFVSPPETDGGER